MKKLILSLIISLGLACGASAQNITLKDGLYYSSSGTLYTGSYIALFESGNKKSSFEISEGKLNGLVTYFYDNGKVMETGFFASNEKNGEWLRWDELGNKIDQAFYVNGKKDGLWLVWDAKGVKRYELHYDLGAKVGKWLMWDESGNLTSEKTYSSL